jgi:hypothetical protein
MENIAAEVPQDLQQADEVLTRYGRWAMDRLRARCCGSAEGMYRAPRGDDDRQPREVLMPAFVALDAQRALARVPERERVVLAALYVPQRLPPQAQLRMLGIAPSMARERHIAGLRMFANLYRWQTMRSERLDSRCRMVTLPPPDHRISATAADRLAAA